MKKEFKFQGLFGQVSKSKIYQIQYILLEEKLGLQQLKSNEET